MSNINLLECPSCGQKAFELPAGLKADLDEKLVCPGCGHEARVREFLAKAREKLVDIAKQRLSKLPNFKKS